jgi:hypothetical protein
MELIKVILTLSLGILRLISLRENLELCLQGTAVELLYASFYKGGPCAKFDRRYQKFYLSSAPHLLQQPPIGLLFFFFKA